YTVWRAIAAQLSVGALADWRNSPRPALVLVSLGDRVILDGEHRARDSDELPATARSARSDKAMKSDGVIAIGIRVLRGKAVAIAIRGGLATPSYAGRAEMMLSDPKFQSTLRPFHAMARLPFGKALPMVKRDEALVRKAASKSVSSFIEGL